MSRVAPGLVSGQAELAWRVGAGVPVESERTDRSRSGVRPARRVRSSPAYGATRPAMSPREHLAGRRGRPGATRGLVLRGAARLDPALPATSRAPVAKPRCRHAGRDARGVLARGDAAGDGRATRVAAVFPEPTPYRAPLLDRVAALDEVELSVVYAAETVAGRTWHVEPRHSAVFLRGARCRVRGDAAPRLPRHARSLAGTCEPGRTSSSSPAGARSLPRQPSPGAGPAASRTSWSSKVMTRPASGLAAEGEGGRRAPIVEAPRARSSRERSRGAR